MKFLLHLALARAPTLDQVYFYFLLIDDIHLIFLFVYLLGFADDIKLFLKVSEHIDSCLRINDDLRRLIEWCDKNELEINISKCNVMTFHRNKNPIFLIMQLIIPF